MSIDAALEQWRKCLGEQSVLTSATEISAYSHTTTGQSREILAILKPSSTPDVIKIVQISAQYKTPLYPISTGNNWGYGSANPVQNNCVIVDLSGMNKIIDMDAQNGIVTLEPGVTQQQMSQYLQDHDLDYLVPVTGAGPNCSLLGNALERGYGITPYADHFAAVTRMEIVLPNGQIYQSALSQIGGEKVDQAFKWGIGPYLDGIFTQGNFGICTSISLALAPKPESVVGFFFSGQDDSDLEQLAVRIQNVLRQLGPVVGSINLMNKRRVLSMMEPYPSDKVAAGEIITDELLHQMGKKNQVMAWTCAGALYGNKRLVKAAKKVIRQLLKPTAKRLVFFTPGMTRFLDQFSQKLPGTLGKQTQKMFGTLNKTLALFSGEPSEVALPLAYWKSGKPPTSGKNFNPSKDGCGLLWYAPLVVLSAKNARNYTTMVEHICLKHGIEPLITLTTLSDRCWDSTVPILFSPNDDDEKARALACYQELIETGQKQGFVPYRTNIDSMAYFTQEGAPYWELAKAIKEKIDPDNLIAPGRYSIY